MNNNEEIPRGKVETKVFIFNSINGENITLPYFFFFLVFLLSSGPYFTQTYRGHRGREENAPLSPEVLSDQRDHPRRHSEGSWRERLSPSMLPVSAATLLSGAWALVTEWLGERLEAMPFLPGLELWDSDWEAE